MVGMEENAELEEGEACYYGDDEDKSIDPDIALSYIDEKIQNVLGHFQKDFEGGVSAENLGAKFGGYGSFLPTYERSPVSSRPKTPQRNCNAHRSPNSLTIEGASQNLKAPSNTAPSLRLGTASCSAHLLHNSRVPSADVSVKQKQFAEKSPLKDESSNRSGNLADQRTLKVRIKVGSDNSARKNAAIYSGLGLDDSPYSSQGNSPDESGGMSPLPRETTGMSPTSIIQTMTSFPVPGGVLISPIHDSMLCLVKREKLPSVSKPMPTLNGHQENSATSVDEFASMMGNRKLLKEKKKKISRKSERQFKVKHEDATDFEDDMTLRRKKISVNESIGCKEFLSSDLTSKQVPKSECDIWDSVKVAGGTSEVLRKGNKDVGKGRLPSLEFVKEKSLESISGEDYSKNEKGNLRSGLMENIHGNVVSNSRNDILNDHNDDGIDQKISASKGYSNGLKCKDELNPQKEMVGLKTEDERTSVPLKMEGLTFEGKHKLKGAQINGKPGAVSAKESSRFGASADLNNKKNTGFVVDSNSKSLRVKSQKDDKNSDNQRDSLSVVNVEQKDNQMDLVRRSFSDRPKDANLGYVGMQQNTFLDKQKGRSIGKKVDEQDTSGLSLKDSSIVCPSTETGLTSEMVPPIAAPVLIEEHWVQCDKCQKWRLLPFGTKPEHLPDKWLCSMLNWLPGMNNCNISEEETTRALNALYQLPVCESQNNLQNHVGGISMGVNLGGVQHLDQNRQNISAHSISSHGKKKQGVKEIVKAGTSSGLSNSDNKLHKSKKASGTNHHHAELNPTKKSGPQQLSKKASLVVDKNMPNQKEYPINGGDAKQIKMKSKREADECGYGTSKKSKTEAAPFGDKYQSSKMDLSRGRISTSTALLTNGSGKDMRKYDEYCLSEDAKLDVRDKMLVSGKKRGEQAQVSLNAGSLDMKMCSKKDVSLKKRKLELDDNKNEIDIFQNSVHDGILYEKEESSESGLRKEKELPVSRIRVKESNANDYDDKSLKRGMILENVLSGIRDHPSDGMVEVRRNDKEKQLRKHKRKISSQRAVDVVESCRRDLGSGQVSVAAASSSSKVSGSHKVVEEMKGSPAESVSSSPSRTSNLDKFLSSGGHIRGKVDATHSGLHVIGDFRRYSDGDSTAEINLSGTVIHPESRNFSAQENRERDGSHKSSGKAKPSSEVMDSHLLNPAVDIVERNVGFLNDLHAQEHGYNEDGRKKGKHDTSVLPKSGNGASLRSKGKSGSSTIESHRDKIKVSDTVNGYAKKNQSSDSEIDRNHQILVHEASANAKYGFPKNLSTVIVKDEKNHVSRSGQWSNETQVRIKLKQDCDGLNIKPSSRNAKLAPEQSPIQDFEGETKAELTRMEPGNGKSKLFSLSNGESKLGTASHGCGPVSGPQKGGVFDSCPTDALDDLSNASKHSGVDGVNTSLGQLVAHRPGSRNPNASSPVRMISSNQIATNTLKEAKDLRDTADRLKSSCFGFESNEAYFQAALKFLHGASLLDTCNIESGRHGEMNQIQAYGTAAKLCEHCALEYEARQEMAAAALAYKCLEVTYMRVVYCKHHSMNRDRHELQATLQVVSQGESPSSSASDVDNLNNQGAVDKGNFLKGTGSHVAGSQVIVARNRPNFLRLLDFTQEVNLAMEASRKSHNAFAAANVILEEEQNRDCIASVKRVIDFSFQDVEELARLVRLAMEAISHSGFSGARD